MRRRGRALLAWTPLCLAVLLLAGNLVLLFTIPPGIAESGGAGDYIFSLALFAFALMGGLIVARRPDQRIGWLFTFVGLWGMAALFPLFAYADLALRPEYDLPLGPEAAWVTTWVWMPMTFGMILTLLVFPTGRLLSKRWLVVPVLSGATLVLLVTGSAVYLWPYRGRQLLDETFPPPGAPSAVQLLTSLSFPVLFGALLLGCVSLILRYRRARGDERQQLKWLLFPVFVLFGGVALEALWTIGGDQNAAFFDILGPIGALGIPVAAGIAVLRHRLLDIDVLISKTVVYAGLAVFIAAVYLGIVILVGRLTIGLAQGNQIVSVAAAALIAIAFQPVRARMHRLANRLVYGKRATPYEAMSEFSHRMAEAFSLEEVLPRVAEAAATGVGGTRGRARVFFPHGEAEYSWPDAADGTFDKTIPVLDGSELIGEISVAKPRGEPYSASEEKLLSDLASQAGMAFRNVRLAEDLRASRRRIVTAQDEERRRMERDIHDGAQQQLVSMAVKLGLARNLLSRDAAKMSELLDELKDEAEESVETLRDLARGLFPQVLVERGPAPAVESHIQKMGIDASVDDRTGGARFDLDVEANVYFVIREALQNASKHASGYSVAARLWIHDGELRFSVKDEGPGFDPEEVQMGSGLQNMADRIEALGGGVKIESAPGRGTAISGRVPAVALETVT